jgi:RND family efflux transporter MFP subunit
MKKSRFLFTLLPVFLLSSCGDEVEIASAPPRPVIVQTIAEAQGSEIRSFSGVVVASGSTTLGFEVAGRITAVIAKEGRRYQEGDLLAQLDVANLSSDLKRANAQALQAIEELKRVQQLFESENASRSDLDSAIASQRAASASVEVAQRQVTNGTLRMPYKGVIQSVEVDEQNVVSAGSPVVIIQGEGAMKVRIGIPAELMTQVKVGMKSTIDIGRLGGKGIPATLDRIFPQAAKNGTYEVSLVLSETSPAILGGMDAEAELTFANPNGETLSVDATAVAGATGETRYVWIVKQGTPLTVTKRIVTVGKLRDGEQIEVLTGLEAGETVVTRGVYQITEGSEVRLQD